MCIFKTIFLSSVKRNFQRSNLLQKSLLNSILYRKISSHLKSRAARKRKLMLQLIDFFLSTRWIFQVLMSIAKNKKTYARNGYSCNDCELTRQVSFTIAVSFSSCLHVNLVPHWRGDLDSPGGYSGTESNAPFSFTSCQCVQSSTSGKYFISCGDVLIYIYIDLCI